MTAAAHLQLCLARLPAFEPTNPWSVAKYAIHLSYGREPRFIRHLRRDDELRAAGEHPHQAGERGELYDELDENAKAARREPGCRQFDVLVDPQDKTKVMLYEIYDDDKAFEAHQQGTAFKKYVAEAVPLLASRERQFWKRI